MSPLPQRARGRLDGCLYLHKATTFFAGVRGLEETWALLTNLQPFFGSCYVDHTGEYTNLSMDCAWAATVPM